MLKVWVILLVINFFSFIIRHYSYISLTLGTCDDPLDITTSTISFVMSKDFLLMCMLMGYSVVNLKTYNWVFLIFVSDLTYKRVGTRIVVTDVIGFHTCWV